MGNKVFLGVRSRPLMAAFWLVLFSVGPAAGQNSWTLEASIRQAQRVASELHAADAVVRGREGALQQAGALPNPQIELRGDNKLGKDDNTGGSDLTQIAISQPLPLSGRLGRAREMATANLNMSQSQRRHESLVLESQVATIFHLLQQATTRLRLANQRLGLDDDLRDAGRLRERAGELSRLERLRLDIIRESAQQAVEEGEADLNEALSLFRSRLGLSAETVTELIPLEPIESVPDLAELQAGMEEHPALEAARQRETAANAGVALARAERWEDPVLSFFREKDFLDDRRQDFTGIGLSLPLPLWDRKSGRISEAQALVAESRSRYDALRRELASRLEKSHLRLSALIRQGNHFRDQVFKPAQALFTLTRRAYTAGEADILSLVDAHDTYFDAHIRYLELIHESWLTAVELRFSAGRSLLGSQPQNTQRQGFPL